jgi:hypothetical protein
MPKRGPGRASFSVRIARAEGGVMRSAFGLCLAATLVCSGRAKADDAAANKTASSAAVQGVVVSAQRPKSQNLLDRKVYVVTGNLQATTGAAADVLNEVPSVDVTADGVVTLRGDPNVTILVDGKPSAAFTGAAAGLSLQQMAASEIDRVEVMANPPARYKAEGSAGVINIITRKTKKPGLVGSVRVNAGPEGRVVLGADATYNAGKWKLSGGVGLRRDIRRRLTTDARTETATGGGAQLSNERIDEHFDRLTPSLKAAADYQADPGRSFGVSASLSDLGGHRWFDQTDAGGPPGQAATSLSLRHSDGHERHIEESEEAHLSQHLWRPGETLDIALQHSATLEHEPYKYANSYFLPPAPQTFDDLRLGLDLEKTELSLDYDLPTAAHGEFKAGYDLEADDDDFDNRGDTLDPVSGIATVDPAVTNHFHYRQTVSALYAQYDRTLGAWSLQGGLRAEATHATWRLITTNVPGGRNDFGVYPSLHAERSLGASDKLSASFSRRLDRPDPEALNPFSDHQDIYNLRAGDPNLRPQDTWSAQAGYSHARAGRAYGLTLYYRLDRDSVTDVEVPLGGGVVLLTKANLPKSRSAGVEFNASGALLRRLSYALSGEGFYSQIDARALGAAGLKSTEGVNLKGSLEYRPTGADTLQVSLSRTDRRLTPQGSIAPINLVNLGYRRQLRPDLAIVVTVSDVLDGQRLRRFVVSPGLADAYQRYQVGQIAYVGVTYSFGGKAKAKPADFEYAQ